MRRRLVVFLCGISSFLPWSNILPVFLRPFVAIGYKCVTLIGDESWPTKDRTSHRGNHGAPTCGTSKYLQTPRPPLPPQHLQTCMSGDEISGLCFWQDQVLLACFDRRLVTRCPKPTADYVSHTCGETLTGARTLFLLLSSLLLLLFGYVCVEIPRVPHCAVSTR